MTCTNAKVSGAFPYSVSSFQRNHMCVLSVISGLRLVLIFVQLRHRGLLWCLNAIIPNVFK